MKKKQNKTQELAYVLFGALYWHVNTLHQFVVKWYKV